LLRCCVCFRVIYLSRMSSSGTVGIGCMLDCVMISYSLGVQNLWDCLSIFILIINSVVSFHIGFALVQMQR
jgi:hypothetical protein